MTVYSNNIALYRNLKMFIYKKNRYDSITTCTATLSDICFGGDSKLITGLDSLGN